MIRRIKLADRALPDYTFAEELTNTLTHGLGRLVSIAALVRCIIKAARLHSPIGVVSSAIYGGCMMTLYWISSVYHGLQPGLAKKVLQIIDHCAIYLMIAGSYTVVALCGFLPLYPELAWGMVIFQWTLAAIAITLTAIDLKAFGAFSMVCYIGMGWAILPFVNQTIIALGKHGFALLLWGGISFTVGAVLYGLGGKMRWMHSTFHVFVLIGSALQFLSIYFYAL